MARQDPHSFTQDNQPATRHVDLDLTVDFATRRIRGTASLHLAKPATGGAWHLDTRGLEVDAVTGTDGKPLPHRWGEADAVIGTCLEVDLPAGCTQVDIRYATAPDATALQWLEPVQTAGGKHPYLFSQCQAIHARSVIPCQDTPAVRITYNAQLTVPADLTAVMAAAEDGVTQEGALKKFRFKMPQAIPPYLFALAVGDLARKPLSPRSSVVAEPSVVDAAAREFEDVEHHMKAAEALFGPYLWDRFDLLVMPPSFPYGGMENPRLTFLTPTLLAGDKSLVNVVAHELAHAWSGNLVTNASLEHFWLNEGLTVYAERRILEVLEGKEKTALHAAVGLSGLREDMARLGNGPLTALHSNLWGVDPDEAYSSVPYEKGCMFFERLERVVGRPAFDAFLRTYLERFAFRSVTAADFVGHLQEHLPQAAKAVDLAVWLDGTGLPADAPQHTSARLDQLTAWAAALPQQTAALAPQLAGLDATDWQVLLPRMPTETVTAETCAWLDDTFHLAQHSNMEIRVAFLTWCARAQFERAYPMVENTLCTVGRMKYLRPLFTALCSHAPGTLLARRILDEAGPGYHPVARNVMEGVLRQAANKN